MDEKKTSNEWKTSSVAPSSTSSLSSSNTERDRNSNTSNAPLHKHFTSSSYTGQTSFVSGRRRERWENSNNTLGGDTRNPRKRDWDVDRDTSFRERSYFRDRDRDRDHSDREWIRDRNRSSSVGIDRDRIRDRDRDRDRDFNNEKFRDRVRDRNSMPPRSSKHFNRSSYFDKDRDFRDGSKLRERYVDRDRKWIPKRDLIRDRSVKPSTTITESDSMSILAKTKTLHAASLTSNIIKTDIQTNSAGEKKDYYGPSDNTFTGKRPTFKSANGIVTEEESHKDIGMESRLRESDRVWEKPRDPRTRESDKVWEKRDRTWDRDRDRSLSTGRVRDTQNLSYRRARSYPTGSRTTDDSRKDDQKLDDIGNSSNSFPKRRSFHKPQHHQTGYTPYFKNNTWVKRPRPHFNDTQKGSTYERGYSSKPKYTPPLNSSHIVPSVPNENPIQRPKVIESIKPTNLTDSTASVPTDPRVNQISHTNKVVHVDEPYTPYAQTPHITALKTVSQDPRHLNDPRRLQNKNVFVSQQYEEKPKPTIKDFKTLEKKNEAALSNTPTSSLVTKSIPLQRKEEIPKVIGKSNELPKQAIEQNLRHAHTIPKKSFKRQASDISEDMKDSRKKKKMTENLPNREETSTNQVDSVSLGSQNKALKSEEVAAAFEDVNKQNETETKKSLVDEIKESPKKKDILEIPSKKDQKSKKQLTCASLGPPDKVAKAERVVKRLNELNSKNVGTTNAGENVLPLPTKSRILKGISTFESEIKGMQTKISKLKEEIKDSINMEEEKVKEAERKSARNIELSKKRKLQIETVQKKIFNLNHSMQENEKCEKIISGRFNSNKAMEMNMEQEDSTESKVSEYDQREEEMNIMQVNIVKLHQELNGNVEEYENILVNLKSRQEKVDDSNKVLRRLSIMDNSYLENGSIVTATHLSHDLKALANSVFMENKCTAMEAQIDSLSSIPCNNDANDINVGEENYSNSEWNSVIRKITSQANALYIHPEKSPLFLEHDERHKKIKNKVKTSIQQKKQKVQERWRELAHEYIIRQKKFIGESGKGVISSSLSSSYFNGGNFSIMGGIDNTESSQTSLQSHSRSSSNPYRRPRRGNGGISASHQDGVVRSEYEQEQIIAELTAKEAMEKRIATGFCALPRQRCQVEMVRHFQKSLLFFLCLFLFSHFLFFKDLHASFYDYQSNRRVLDPVCVENERKKRNPWTDVEKCIFLDRFLQDPKNFRKIASSLRNKSTKDCIEFYYISKKTVPYKLALREYHLRRKRRAENCWEGTIQAAIAMGAVILEGPSREKPVVFALPPHDNTYNTHSLHPMKRELFDSVAERTGKAKGNFHTSKPNRSGQLFLLDDFKFLRKFSTDFEVDEPVPKKKVIDQDHESLAEGLLNLRKNDGAGKSKLEKKNGTNQSASKTSNGGTKKGSPKWSSEEKILFTETVEKYGKFILGKKLQLIMFRYFLTS